MAIQLDHFIVPSRQQAAAARRLAELLGVPWGEKGLGPFSPVYLNDGLTLDFQDTDEAFPVHHYCFRVTQQEFDAILARIQAAGIPYRSTVHGPVDRQVGKAFGNVYWNDPEGHQWEMLTVSYARQGAR
jgi:catechol 2,3-dioxygenase-like lactoylglutathione lyase family enzyme